MLIVRPAAHAPRAVPCCLVYAACVVVYQKDSCVAIFSMNCFLSVTGVPGVRPLLLLGYTPQHSCAASTTPSRCLQLVFCGRCWCSLRRQQSKTLLVEPVIVPSRRTPFLQVCTFQVSLHHAPRFWQVCSLCASPLFCMVFCSFPYHYHILRDCGPPAPYRQFAVSCEANHPRGCGFAGRIAGCHCNS